jgi:hypothetical protein
MDNGLTLDGRAAKARAKRARDMVLKSATPGDAIRPGRRLSLVPILEVDQKDLSDIMALLPETLGFDGISLRPTVRDVPSICFEGTRGQYKAPQLLALISAMGRDEDELLLGVTMLDLTPP